MKLRKDVAPILIGLAFVLSISSCQFIADVFKGGVYVGIFLVIAVIALIIWLLSKIVRK